MSHANGKVYSEVVNGVKVGINTDDVSAVLGVASHDDGTLCMSEKINEHSLIRPVYTDYPDVVPEESAYKNTDTDTSARNICGSAPSSSMGGSWQKAKWGYWVPVISEAAFRQGSFRLLDQPWVRRKPTATSFKSILHFDGYRHDVRATNAIADYEAASGRPMTVTFQFDAADANITRTNGVNDGGVVGLANVLPGLFLGVMIAEENGSAWDYYVINTDKQITAAGFPTGVKINTGENGSNGSKYYIYPVAVKRENDSKTGAVLWYAGLKYASDAVSSMMVEVSAATSTFSGVEWDDRHTVTKVGNTVTAYDFTVWFRILPSLAAGTVLSNFEVEVTYYSKTGGTKAEVYSFGADVQMTTMGTAEKDAEHHISIPAGTASSGTLNGQPYSYTPSDKAKTFWKNIDNNRQPIIVSDGNGGERILIYHHVRIRAKIGNSYTAWASGVIQHTGL